MLSSMLASAGCTISEENQVLTLCNGIDGEYDSIVANIQEGYVSIQELTHRLLAQEGRLEKRSSAMALQSSTNVASTNANLGNNNPSHAHANPRGFLIPTTW